MCLSIDNLSYSCTFCRLENPNSEPNLDLILTPLTVLILTITGIWWKLIRLQWISAQHLHCNVMFLYSCKVTTQAYFWTWMVVWLKFYIGFSAYTQSKNSWQICMSQVLQGWIRLLAGLASFCQWPVKTVFFRGKNRPGKNSFWTICRQKLVFATGKN